MALTYIPAVAAFSGSAAGSLGHHSDELGSSAASTP